ncbi:MAG: MBL fold metallo-hydrolase [Anaerolineae bacterium]|nr:MBL fold metallo-hydrolase [Anaerolineae bacterium]
MHTQFWLILGLCLAGCTPATAILPTATATADGTPAATTTVTPVETAATMPVATATSTAPAVTLIPETRMPMTITVIYDNVTYDTRLKNDWGFACLVEGPNSTLLFDTGGKSDILLENMHTLGFDPRDVDTVFLSHFHADHTGGLAGFLAENPNVTVIMPQSFPESLKASVRQAGAEPVEVSGPATVNAWARSTGELGGQIREQALVIESEQGLVVITGCAHPGIVTMVRQAQPSGDAIHLVMGGFHLRDANATQIAGTIAGLQALGVEQIAPSHCTGDAAIRAFADAFGPAYRAGGAGQGFTVTVTAP